MLRAVKIDIDDYEAVRIGELIKMNNIIALIKTDQEKWDACLIKTGPSSYVMDVYGLPKQRHGVQQPDWVYKRSDISNHYQFQKGTSS